MKKYSNMLEDLKQFIYSEITERRDYTASKMCEVILEEISRLEKSKTELDLKAILEKYDKDGDECLVADDAYDDGFRLKYGNYTAEEFIWWLDKNNYKITK